ncbi:hypothetical protein [Xenorhabdus bharatensis]|uniref:hypothetical protein n=1 Tax=Xenorhabdus bharatensis TaxID=3136256 RepID=UPI0030F48EA1
MKKLFMTFVMLILTGCDTEHSKYNGVYNCKIVRIMNYIAVDRGSEYSFPLGTVKTRMTFENGVMTIHGMNSGDYVGHEMSMNSSSITPDGKKSMSEWMFKYDNGEFSEGFSPHSGIAMITIGNPPNDGVVHHLTNCKKEQE